MKVILLVIQDQVCFLHLILFLNKTQSPINSDIALLENGLKLPIHDLLHRDSSITSNTDSSITI
jgi:hypothetical protein